jgi:NADH-quinone oxidoreductase subunit J
MVLFVFVVMMLNLGPRTIDQERHWLHPGIWIGPSVLAGFLLAELIYILIHVHPMTAAAEVGPKQLALTLFGPYLLGVELASMLLLAGLVGAYHLGQRPQKGLQREGN